MAWEVASTYCRSGSRVAFSGVGTQIRMASAWASRSKSVVAWKRPEAAISATTSEAKCWM